MTVLFVNACVRENSRTKILADYLLKKIGEKIEEINLNDDKPVPFDRALLEKRDRLIGLEKFDDDIFSYAKKFAQAEQIVVAAPFWDFSFPAVFKAFIEHVNVSGLVFKYTNDGIKGLCKAKKLYYVTTMGGYNSTDFGFGYVKALSQTLYGISDVKMIKAEGLDVIGNDVDAIIQEAKVQIDEML